jgi:hypothetical protein
MAWFYWGGGATPQNGERKTVKGERESRTWNIDFLAIRQKKNS